jgi:uncharacterized protein (DUF4415 family)
MYLEKNGRKPVVFTERNGDTRLIPARVAAKTEKSSYFMETIITLRAGQKPTKEQIREVREAAKRPPVYDPDCPPSSPEALAEFAAKARELRRNMKRIRPVVTLRIVPDCLEKYKSLGKGCAGIMADVLSCAADKPEVL